MPEPRLELATDVGIADAASLHEALYNLLESEGNRIELVAGSVEACDTAILQLLVSFFVEAEQRKKTIQWGSISEPLLIAAQTLGVDKLLGINVQSVEVGQ